MSYEHLLEPSLQESVQRAVQDVAQLQFQDQDLPLDQIMAGAFAFPHTPTPPRPFRIAASDGSGSFPLADRDTVFLYLVTADALCYQAEVALNPLRRDGPIERVNEVLVWAEHWSEAEKEAWLDRYYHQLTGKGFRQIAAESDYLTLKRQYAQRSVPRRVEDLEPILYSASETDAIRKILMGSAELAVALRTLHWEHPPDIVLLDGTLSLPSLSRSETILTNVLKRHVMHVARQKGVSAIALSTSSTFPGATEIARALTQHFGDTHWAYRFPTMGEEPLGIEGLSVPPPGAVTYLVRFHRESPALRLDFDLTYWQDQGGDIWVQQLLPLLDFSSHEARSFGYPYPLFAAHVRCSLTQNVRRAAKTMLFARLRDAGFDVTEFAEIHTVLGIGDW